MAVVSDYASSEKAMIASERWVWLARVRRTQGRKGEVFAEILTDFPEKFAARRRLWLLPKTSPADAGVPVSEAREMELQHHWLHKGGAVLHFAGVDSISAAEELAGCIVAVPRAERVPLEEGDVYISDLIGCVLVDVAAPEAVVVGEIEDVDRSAGPVAILAIRPTSSAGSHSRNEVLVPFAKEYLRRIDLDARRVEMSLPEGLLDLNP